MTDSIISGLIGLLSGFGVKFFYDEIKQPNIKINCNSSELEYVCCTDEQTSINYLVCRIFIYNKVKLALNSVATNCIAWIAAVNRETKEQINWVGEHDTLDINVDDYQKVNLFAIRWGSIGDRLSPPHI
jgi:hypothetical protein